MREISQEEMDLRLAYAEGLNETHLESLRQYANECRMRPGEFADEWRNVPTSNDEFRYAAEGAYWLHIANTF